jgi:hypothetical protein
MPIDGGEQSGERIFHGYFSLLMVVSENSSEFLQISTINIHTLIFKEQILSIAMIGYLKAVQIQKSFCT